MKAKIAVLPGDYIGKEVVAEAIKVLDAIGSKYNHKFEYTYAPAGCTAIDECNDPMPDSTLDVCKASDAVLLGAVGGPVSGSKYDDLPGHMRPEAGLLKLRGELELFANLRPAILFDELKGACPLCERITDDGFDIMVVRELTGGMYFGPRGTKDTENGKAAYDTMIYDEMEIERIVRVGFETAMKRDKKLCSVDKANILDNSRLWRVVAEKVAKEFPDVKLTHMYVDNAAMQIALNPGQFDVIVTGNMFGDILSDIAGAITGSIGMLPSASLAKGTFGLYEPVHGSAPDIAGKGLANPLATILSISMLLKYSFGLKEEAACVDSAVDKALKSGLRTGDIALKSEKTISTTKMGDAIVGFIKQ